MRYLLLVSGGRNGSLFFQSLLDGHPEILQLPGLFYLDEFLGKIQSTKNLKGLNPEAVAKIFINSYGEFFDTRRNTLHRMGALGNNRDEHLEVSANEFLDYYLSAAECNNSDLKAVIQNLHIAWNLAAGEKLEKKKIILIHIHHAHRIRRMKRFVNNLDFRVIFMERDILPSLASEYNRWEKFTQRHYGKDLALEAYSRMLNRKLLEPIRVALEDSKAFSILLEELHKNSRMVLYEFCKEIEIEFNSTMLDSTFGGKLWWGDELGEFKNGFNPGFINKFNEKNFFRWEIKLIEKFVFARQNANGYQKFEAGHLSALLFLLPGKMEIINLVEKLKNIGSTTGLKTLLRDVLFSYRFFTARLEIIVNLPRSKMPLRTLVRYRDTDI